MKLSKPVKITVEAIIVGIAFLFLFMLVHVVDMKFINGNYAMSHTSMAIQAFLAGFIGHITFELTGVNKWYVKRY